MVKISPQLLVKFTDKQHIFMRLYVSIWDVPDLQSTYEVSKNVKFGLLNEMLYKMLTLSSTTALECAPFARRASSSSDAPNCSSMGTQSSSSRTSSST